MKCKDHPEAPHGFDRDASHAAGEYVCECESWEPSCKREWVGLTDEEIWEVERLATISYQRHKHSIRGQQVTSADNPQWHYARAIEAKLKEKNT
jgi:hypothetical protein